MCLDEEELKNLEKKYREEEQKEKEKSGLKLNLRRILSREEAEKVK